MRQNRIRFAFWFGFICFLFISACSPKDMSQEFGDLVKQEVKSSIEETLQEVVDSKPSSSSPSPTEPNMFEAELVSVTDGDTIKVRINGVEESVRFLLVDTPETNHPKLGEQPFGKEAKAFTESLLNGKTVLLEKDVSERDKYGRLLMYVYTPDGKSVQEELLKNGLARVAYVYAPNTKHVDRYKSLQEEARQAKLGIWLIENYVTDQGFNKEAVQNP